MGGSRGGPAPDPPRRPGAMANLHKAELQMICADYHLELPPSATVPEIIRVLRNFLLRKRGKAPPVITAQPAITPAPKITAQMPPDAPPLTDSDDDIVITVEPM